MPKKFQDSEARRHPLNMKTTAGLRERLEKASAESGRALTHEVEHRVEQSFLFERTISSLTEKARDVTVDLLVATAGGPDNLSVGLRIAHLLNLLEVEEEDWRTDEGARLRVAALVAKRLPAIMAKPPMDFTAPRITSLADQAFMDASDVLPIKPRTEREPAPLPSGAVWEIDHTKHKVVDTERDAFASIMSGEVEKDGSNTLNVSDKKKAPRNKQKL